MHRLACRRAALGAGLAALAAAANAQVGAVDTELTNPNWLAAAVQGAGATRKISVVPSLSINERLTDNSRLVTNSKEWDLVSQVSPGIRIQSNGGRVRGFLDYVLTGVGYARNTASNEFQNSLNA